MRGIVPLMLLFAASKRGRGFAMPLPPPVTPVHPEPVIVPHPVPTATSTAVFSAPRPPGVPSFPGPAWTPYTPVPGSVAARAGMLLHTMHMNETRYESGPYGGPVAYHMQPLHSNGTGKMVTAWKLKTLSSPLTT